MFTRFYFYLADAYKNQGLYDSAKMLFKAILCKYDNVLGTKHLFYTNKFNGDYKNAACDTLMEIYLKEHQFDSALHYQNISDTVFTFCSDCGNAYEINNGYVAWKYGLIYHNIHQTDKAIEVMLKTALYLWPSGVKDLKTYLKERGDSNLALRLKQAVSGIQKQSKKSEDGKKYVYRYTLFFLGIDISYPCYYGDDFPKKRALEIIRQSTFYRELTKE